MSVSAQRYAVMRELEAFHGNAFQTKAVIAGVTVRKRARYVVDETHPDGSAVIRMEVEPFKEWESVRFTASEYQAWLRSRSAERERNRGIVMRALGTAKE